MATGIPPSTWIDEGYEAMVTAIEVLERARGKANAKAGGPQMSG